MQNDKLKELVEIFNTSEEEAKAIAMENKDASTCFLLSMLVAQQGQIEILIEELQDRKDLEGLRTNQP